MPLAADGAFFVPDILNAVRSHTRFFAVFTLLACGLQAETLLVLPLFNLSKSKSLDWIGESISESIIEAYSAQGRTVVRPEVRDEILRQMNVRRYVPLTKASVMELAVNLDADVVLYGEFDFTPAPAGSASKGSLRVSTRVLDVKKMRKGPEFSVTGPLEELSTIQANMAWQASAGVPPGVAMSEQDFRRRHPPVRVDALENYVRGLQANSAEQKYRFFTIAARLEPGFSQPCFQLGKMNFDKGDYRAAAGWLAKVSSEDQHYQQALFLLGTSRLNTGDFKGAEQALRQVAKVVPLPEVLNNLGAALLRSGDPGAVGVLQEALNTDNADPDYHFNLGYALWRSGSYQAAAEQFRATLDRNPSDETATLLLGRCLKQQAPRPGDAKTDALERLKTQFNDSAWLALKSMLENKN